MRTSPSIVLLALVAILPLSLGACGDDRTTPLAERGPGGNEDIDAHADPDAIVLQGQVVRVEDDSGYGPVPIVLFDVKSLRAVKAAMTGSDGAFLFDELEGGEYVPVVYARTRQLLPLDAGSFALSLGDQVDLMLRMVPIEPSDWLGQFGHEMFGKVTDATTQEPIAGAVVEMSSPQEQVTTLFSELSGFSNPLNSVTNDAGEYRIFPLPVLPIGLDERIPHIRVTASGYRSRFLGGWRRDQVPEEFDIELEPGGDDAVITGRLVKLGTNEPVPGIRVAVEWRRGGDRFPKGPAGKSLVMDAIGESGADGLFRIEGLPIGGFVLNPSYPTNDGWLGQQQVTANIINATQEVNVGKIFVTPAMKPLEPVNGSTIDDLYFWWEPAELATSYTIIFARGSDGVSVSCDTEETAFKPNEEQMAFFADDGRYLWTVIAYQENGNEASRMERSQTFDLQRN